MIPDILEIKAQHSDEEWKHILEKSLKEANENPFPAHILEVNYIIYL